MNIIELTCCGCCLPLFSSLLCSCLCYSPVIDVASSFTQFTVYGLYSFCALCARAGILRAILDSISKKLKKGFCKNLFQTQASDGQRLWRLRVKLQVTSFTSSQINPNLTIRNNFRFPQHPVSKLHHVRIRIKHLQGTRHDRQLFPQSPRTRSPTPRANRENPRFVIYPNQPRRTRTIRSHKHPHPPRKIQSDANGTGAMLLPHFL